MTRDTVYDIQMTADVEVTIPGEEASSLDRVKMAKTNESRPNLDIIDIRRSTIELDIKEEIKRLFRAGNGPRKLPTLLLYDEKGLQLFEQITYLDEYYLTNDEISLLEKHSEEIATHIANGSMVVELGSGNLRKVNLLLQAIERAGKSVDYYALDLARPELERTLAQLPRYEHVRSHGLWGTYDDGCAWLKNAENMRRQKCILTMGSSIGNFHRPEASDFLRQFADVLSSGDKVLVGLDGCIDPAKVYHAYNDQHGVTHQFILNGLTNANTILGEEAFKLDEWTVIGEYVYDDEGGRHQAFYAPTRDTTVFGETVKAQERVQVEQSLKYSSAAAVKLWDQAALQKVAEWTANDDYGLHMLEKPKMPFSLIPAAYASGSVPTLADWAGLWSAWDAVTTQMLPQEELQNKPIKLRNACIFYLGHIPTFLDMQLTNATKEPWTEPQHFPRIFERGIDPDVDNPEQCHAHSEIPEEWPSLDVILDYQDRVRQRLIKLYDVEQSRTIGRAQWIAFEHEVMHLETLLYMMLQSDKTLPPPNTLKPDFETLAKRAKAARVPDKWLTVPAQEITVGIDDPEDLTDVSRHHGWDNEKPARKVKVHSFEAQRRPITNEEYAQYLQDEHIDKLPASWARCEAAVDSHTNGHVTPDGFVNGSPRLNGVDQSDSLIPAELLNKTGVRTVYGIVPLKLALDWPIFASYDELAGCAAWLGGRIPTFEETRSLYEYAERLKNPQFERKLGRTVPAVNGHLINNGVEETPPSRAAVPVDGEASQDDLFVDLSGANVGLQHWHPMAVTGNGNKLCGQSEMGGVWEWTSSPLTKWDDFEPMSLYPAYTADFFDGKHNIVLGGSWATHPRIAGRKSFVNWYQRNYPYAWVGARVVRDLPTNGTGHA